MLIDPKWMRFYSRISGAVMLKVLMVGAGYWAGSRLDERFHTFPWLTFLLLVVSMSLGIWWIVWIANHTKLE